MTFKHKGKRQKYQLSLSYKQTVVFSTLLSNRLVKAILCFNINELCICGPYFMS